MEVGQLLCQDVNVSNQALGYQNSNDNNWFNIVVDCGDPGTPINGATTGTDTTFGSVVTHSCDDGFVLDGADKQICLESGNWSAPLPSCNSTSLRLYSYE